MTPSTPVKIIRRSTDDIKPILPTLIRKAVIEDPEVLYKRADAIDLTPPVKEVAPAKKPAAKGKAIKKATPKAAVKKAPTAKKVVAKRTAPAAKKATAKTPAAKRPAAKKAAGPAKRVVKAVA